MMTVKEFAKHFDLAWLAPDAISRLSPCNNLSLI